MSQEAVHRRLTASYPGVGGTTELAVEVRSELAGAIWRHSFSVRPLGAAGGAAPVGEFTRTSLLAADFRACFVLWLLAWLPTTARLDLREHAA